jgi:hypothetical protein
MARSAWVLVAQTPALVKTAIDARRSYSGTGGTTTSLMGSTLAPAG